MDKNQREIKKENFKSVAHQYFRKEDIFLVPNILSYIRILLIIAFAICYMTEFSINENELAHIYISAGIMMLAAYSDFIDGYIARAFNQISNLGKFLDPLADKLLQLAIGIVILINYYSSPYVVSMFAIFIAKEATLFFENLLLASKGLAINGAQWYGKVSSFVFYIVTAFILLAVPIIDVNLNNPSLTSTIINICCSITMVVLIFAWIMYLVLYFKMTKKQKKSERRK